VQEDVCRPLSITQLTAPMKAVKLSH